jgi:hypothetical protein
MQEACASIGYSAQAPAIAVGVALRETSIPQETSSTNTPSIPRGGQGGVTRGAPSGSTSSFAAASPRHFYALPPPVATAAAGPAPSVSRATHARPPQGPNMHLAVQSSPDLSMPPVPDAAHPVSLPRRSHRDAAQADPAPTSIAMSSPLLTHIATAPTNHAHHSPPNRSLAPSHIAAGPTYLPHMSSSNILPPRGRTQSAQAYEADEGLPVAVPFSASPAASPTRPSHTSSASSSGFPPTLASSRQTHLGSAPSVPSALPSHGSHQPNSDADTAPSSAFSQALSPQPMDAVSSLAGAPFIPPQITPAHVDTLASPTGSNPLTQSAPIPPSLPPACSSEAHAQRRPSASFSRSSGTLTPVLPSPSSQARSQIMPSRPSAADGWTAPPSIQENSALSTFSATATHSARPFVQQASISSASLTTFSSATVTDPHTPPTTGARLHSSNSTYPTTLPAAAMTDLHVPRITGTHLRPSNSAETLTSLAPIAMAVPHAPVNAVSAIPFLRPNHCQTGSAPSLSSTDSARHMASAAQLLALPEQAPSTSLALSAHALSVHADPAGAIAVLPAPAAVLPVDGLAATFPEPSPPPSQHPGIFPYQAPAGSSPRQASVGPSHHQASNNDAPALFGTRASPSTSVGLTMPRPQQCSVGEESPGSTTSAVDSGAVPAISHAHIISDVNRSTAAGAMGTVVVQASSNTQNVCDGDRSTAAAAMGSTFPQAARAPHVQCEGDHTTDAAIDPGALHGTMHRNAVHEESRVAAPVTMGVGSAHPLPACPGECVAAASTVDLSSVPAPEHSCVMLDRARDAAEGITRAPMHVACVPSSAPTECTPQARAPEPRHTPGNEHERPLPASLETRPVQSCCSSCEVPRGVDASIAGKTSCVLHCSRPNNGSDHILSAPPDASTAAGRNTFGRALTVEADASGQESPPLQVRGSCPNPGSSTDEAAQGPPADRLPDKSSFAAAHRNGVHPGTLGMHDPAIRIRGGANGNGAGRASSDLTHQGVQSHHIDVSSPAAISAADQQAGGCSGQLRVCPSMSLREEHTGTQATCPSSDSSASSVSTGRICMEPDQPSMHEATVEEVPPRRFPLGLRACDAVPSSNRSGAKRDEPSGVVSHPDGNGQHDDGVAELMSVYPTLTGSHDRNISSRSSHRQGFSDTGARGRHIVSAPAETASGCDVVHAWRPVSSDSSGERDALSGNPATQ